MEWIIRISGSGSKRSTLVKRYFTVTVKIYNGLESELFKIKLRKLIFI